MKVSSHALILPALVLSVACLWQRANSQTRTESKTDNATVSGKVTIKGKPAAGIVVGMRLSRPDQYSSTYKAKTDQDGVYHITKVASGGYLVAPVAPAWVMTDSVNNPQGQAVIVNESENAEGINFDLTPGGVITGKVIDSEGHALIEEHVSLTPADERDQRRPLFINAMTTDDRGVYRIFGVPAGRYKVSVGDPRFGGLNRRQVAAQTFYPDVTDVAKAGIVNVEEGSEANKIDITVGEAPQGYSVTGRVVDEESGAPVANVFINLTTIQIIDANTRNSSQYSSAQTDAQGQFRLPNARPGKYELTIYPPEDSDLRAEAPVAFDVIDQDVSGLVVKTTKGATIAGIVVFEGGKNNPAQPPSRMWVMVDTRSENNNGSTTSSGRSVSVKPDGTFFAGGLAAGIVNLNVNISTTNQGYSLTRIERDGVVQPNGIQIQNGEHVSGVRLVMTFSSGSIRGIVRIENGTLPPTARMFIQIMKAGDQTPVPSLTEVDARGHFLVEALAAGSYELHVMVYAPEWQQQRRAPPISAKQIVTVNDGGATDVTLTLDLTPQPNP